MSSSVLAHPAMAGPRLGYCQRIDFSASFGDSLRGWDRAA
jgi:hypothetical protein